MSLQPSPLPSVPEDTARVFRAVCQGRGHLYLTLGEQLGPLFDGIDFSPLYGRDGKPALAPNLLALVVVFQFLEDLPDRQAAEAVRLRLDWKYALHLPLEDAGFDASVLSEFRERLAQHGTAQQMFEQVLARLQSLGLLKAGGRQRTDATHVLAATRGLNRLQRASETLRLALTALADGAPQWLEAVALPHWYERYGQPLTDFRLPRQAAQREALVLSIAADGYHLLAALADPPTPVPAGPWPELRLLAQVWQQEFEQSEDGPRVRARAALPAGSQTLQTPHDPEARFSTHGTQRWTGYKSHWTETCEDDAPHLITDVRITPATTPDVLVIPDIQAALAQRALLPAQQLVDAGYVSGCNLAQSAEQHELELYGPMEPDSNWQAQVPGGVTLAQFQLDWARQVAICPQGQRSQRWQPGGLDRHGLPRIEVIFPQAACQACALRERCTHATRSGRTLTLNYYHAYIQAARQRQQTEAFRLAYARRVGIESTLSAAVRCHGARETRYFGQAKTELQALLTAMALNLKRAACWLMGDRPAAARTNRLTCLAPAQLAL